MARFRTLVRVLFETSRPTQLLLIIGVYGFGVLIAAAAGTTLSPRPILAGALALLPTAASVHYVNEYADYETDALTERTPFSGGSGALHRTGLPRRVPLRAATVSLLTGAVLTAGFAVLGWLPLPAAALLAVIAVFGWQYSVGPLRLAWRGWGELDNAALGGLVLPVYGGAVVGGPLGFVALASVPFFLVVLLNLFATQWPDREADRRAGKRTLAVQWSPRRLRRVYAAVAVLAGVALFALAGRAVPVPVALASAPAAPLVVYGAYGYTERTVPWPTVTAMVALLVLQSVGWLWTLR